MKADDRSEGRVVDERTVPPVQSVAGGDLSRIGLGCSRIGSFGNTTPMRELRALIAQAQELGVNVFDTADIYGQGDSERLLGRSLVDRDRAFVVTKVGKLFSARMRLLRPFKGLLRPIVRWSSATRRSVVGAREANLLSDFTPSRLRPALEASLRRLRMEAVDGLLLHSPPAEVVADPRVGAALAELRQAGKVRHFGVSCDSHDVLEEALHLEGLTLLELPPDVLDQAVQAGTAATIARRGIAVLAREVIRLNPTVPPAEAVATIAERPEVRSVIVGTSSIEHLRDLVSVLHRRPARLA